MHENGQEVQQNYALALELYQLAADQGNAKAQSNLDVLYYHGRGVSKNHSRAAELFNLAADQGHAEAQWNIAILQIEYVVGKLRKL